MPELLLLFVFFTEPNTSEIWYLFSFKPPCQLCSSHLNEVLHLKYCASLIAFLTGKKLFSVSPDLADKQASLNRSISLRFHYCSSTGQVILEAWIWNYPPVWNYVFYNVSNNISQNIWKNTSFHATCSFRFFFLGEKNKTNKQENNILMPMKRNTMNLCAARCLL